MRTSTLTLLSTTRHPQWSQYVLLNWLLHLSFQNGGGEFFCWFVCFKQNGVFPQIPQPLLFLCFSLERRMRGDVLCWLGQRLRSLQGTARRGLEYQLSLLLSQPASPPTPGWGKAWRTGQYVPQVTQTRRPQTGKHTVCQLWGIISQGYNKILHKMQQTELCDLGKKLRFDGDQIVGT